MARRKKPSRRRRQPSLLKRSARKRPAKNPLLARPPKGVHGLGVAAGQHARRVLGRPVRDEDYYGVHTTGSLDVAAAYAVMTARATALEEDDESIYPVVLVLDVSGLKPLPDIDALVQAHDFLGDESFRRQFEDVELHEVADAVSDYESDIGPGSRVDEAIFENAQGFIAGRIGNAFEAAYPDEDEAEAAYQHWIETGDFDESLGIHLIDQKRYMTDVGYDRLAEVLAVKPWHDEILDYEDPDQEEEIQRLEAQGYDIFTQDDIYNIDPTTKVVVEGSAKGASHVEYHGTSSWHAERAFPELDLPPNPFPISERDEEMNENPRRRSSKIRRRSSKRSSNPPMRYVVVPVDTNGDDRDDVAFVLQGYPLHRDDALRTVAHVVHVDDMVNQADTRVFRAKHEAERYAAQMAPRTRFLD